MVCFICKLCTEYIFFFKLWWSRRKKTAITSKPCCFLHLLEMTSLSALDAQNHLDFLSCWHTGWRNREHCSQIQHYQLLYCQQNTSAKTNFLRKVLTIFWKQNQEKYQEGCGLRRALPNYQMRITRNNLRFGHSTFTWFTKASLRS